MRQKEQKVDFKFRIGYRLEDSSKKNDSFVLEHWLKRENDLGQGEIVLSLKSESLNLIY